MPDGIVTAWPRRRLDPRGATLVHPLSDAHSVRQTTVANGERDRFGCCSLREGERGLSSFMPWVTTLTNPQADIGQLHRVECAGTFEREAGVGLASVTKAPHNAFSAAIAGRGTKGSATQQCRESWPTTRWAASMTDGAPPTETRSLRSSVWSIDPDEHFGSRSRATAQMEATNCLTRRSDDRDSFQTGQRKITLATVAHSGAGRGTGEPQTSPRTPESLASKE